MTTDFTPIAFELLAEATTGRPIVVQKGFGPSWFVQVNARHFVSEPGNPVVFNAVLKELEKLVESGLLTHPTREGQDFYLHITATGRNLLQSHIAM